jgi:hypothetical protein
VLYVIFHLFKSVHRRHTTRPVLILRRLRWQGSHRCRLVVSQLREVFPGPDSYAPLYYFRLCIKALSCSTV